MITEAAPAKINLALHVRARRADGYHEIETLFAFCRDGDVLHLDRADAPAFRIEGRFAAALVGDGENLVTQAERLFGMTFGISNPHSVTLDKRLPVASGIGGGSADAAAMLRGLARLHGIAPEDSRLLACAEQLGSDVPACLLGRTAFGAGRGERLIPLDGVAGIPVLLVNPGVAVATAKVFAAWDRVDRGPITGATLKERVEEGRNDLAEPARSLAPEIDAVLSALDETSGAMVVRMSGSGATCFALYDTAANRAAAAAVIHATHPAWWCLATALT